MPRAVPGSEDWRPRVRIMMKRTEAKWNIRSKFRYTHSALKWARKEELRQIAVKWPMHLLVRWIILCCKYMRAASVFDWRLWIPFLIPHQPKLTLGPLFNVFLFSIWLIDCFFFLSFAGKILGYLSRLQPFDARVPKQCSRRCLFFFKKTLNYPDKWSF